jgi:hypothetical protein
LADAANVGTVNSSSDGTVVSATTIGSVVMTTGQSGINYNFGDLNAVTIAGMVYEDTNDSGAMVSGDPGISGVTLTLSGTNDQGAAITATTTTAGNGTYRFTTDSNGNPLSIGTYQIVETQPSGYLLGAATVGTVNGSSDGVVVSATTVGSIVFTSGQPGINYNFGDLKPVTLTGTVYVDNNGTGVFGTPDTGIGGVTVTLSGTNDQGTSITATTTTAANGSYSFATDSNGNALRPGTYTITETQPSGYLPGLANVGTVNGASDGTAQSHTQIVSIVMPEGQAGINYNFGQVLPVSVSGYVYMDTNQDRVKDNGETSDGLADVIQLTGTDIYGNSVNLTTTTDATGFYSFTNLMPGTYTVTFVTTTSPYQFEWANVGTVNGVTVGMVAQTNTLGQIKLTSGAAGINYDFAEIIAGS